MTDQTKQLQNFVAGTVCHVGSSAAAADIPAANQCVVSCPLDAVAAICWTQTDSAHDRPKPTNGMIY